MPNIWITIAVVLVGAAALIAVASLFARSGSDPLARGDLAEDGEDEDDDGDDIVASLVRSYPSYVAGLRYRDPVTGIDRSTYAAARVSAGDALDLVPEPDNPHDSDAVRFEHGGFRLGYVPARHSWVVRALAEGKNVTAAVRDIHEDEAGHIAIDVQISIIEDMDA